MKQYSAKDIRNVALVGHAGSGKTSLAEAAFYLSGKAERLGRVADGTTVCDFDPEEIRRKASVSTAILPVEWKETKINLLDTPGLFDFAGGMREGIRAAGSTIIVLSGKSGLTVGAQKGYAAARKKGIATIFFVNKLDNPHADFYKVIGQLKEAFGSKVCPIVVPQVIDHEVKCYINLLEDKAYTYNPDGKSIEVPVPELGGIYDEMRQNVFEAVAETNEEMMEKYFAGEPFTKEEIIEALSVAIRRGEIAPVFCGSAQRLDGIDQLLDGLYWLAPWAQTVAGETATNEAGESFRLTVDDNEPTVAIVFKTVVDRFVGKMLYFKVVSGKVAADSTLYNPRTGVSEKIGKVLSVRGEKTEEVPYVGAGDIGAVAKLVSTGTGDTLCAPERHVILPRVQFDAPSLSMAVFAVNKGEEEKIATGLTRLMEEDPTITFATNPETKESILSGLGEQHLDVIVSKLKSKFGVDVRMEEPRIAYRETIRRKVKVQGRHKKQSGGHGQFGDVWVEFEPWDCDGLLFEENVFGGSVPKNFFPAVEKGLIDSAKKGILAGFPVVGVKATLVDGSYHPVDSSEMAFKTAASLAYKAGIAQADPILLEPILNVQVTVPNDNTGDIMGDINKRRGRVLGMNPSEEEEGMTVVVAEVPQSEMADYSTMLRSTTQGSGSFSTSFERYEEMPQPNAQRVIAQYHTDNEE